MKEPAPHLLTTDEAADRLSVSRSTVKRLVAAHELAPIRIGAAVRFTTDHLDAYVARKSAAAERDAGWVL